jgi:catechol 2,3-dioxygenase-like lactoylglutathione lyase family enzyme
MSMPRLLVFAASIAWFAAAMPTHVQAGGHDGASAPSSATTDPYLHRPNLVVSDIDRALRVYRDILGFRVNMIMPVRAADFMRSVFEFPPEAEMRIAFLSNEKGSFGHIGLTEVKGIELPASQKPYSTVLIIEHQRDVDALYQQIREEGCDVSPIFDLTGPTRREFIFTDHDGHRVLMMKLLGDSSG